MNITFRRSGDLDRDKFRLKELYDRVRDLRGRDRFFILLEANGKRYELAFPNDACTISERLINELTNIFEWKWRSRTQRLRRRARLYRALRSLVHCDGNS